MILSDFRSVDKCGQRDAVTCNEGKTDSGSELSGTVCCMSSVNSSGREANLCSLPESGFLGLRQARGFWYSDSTEKPIRMYLNPLSTGMKGEIWGVSQSSFHRDEGGDLGCISNLFPHG